MDSRLKDADKEKNLHSQSHFQKDKSGLGKDKDSYAGGEVRGEAGPFATSASASSTQHPARYGHVMSEAHPNITSSSENKPAGSMGTHISGGAWSAAYPTSSFSSSTSSSHPSTGVGVGHQESSVSMDARAAEKWHDARENAAVAKDASAQAVKDSAEAGKLKMSARVQGGKETLADAGEKIAETTETAKILAKDAKDTVVEKVKGAKDTVMEKASEAKQAVDETIEQGKLKVADANIRAKEKLAEEREDERQKQYAATVSSTSTSTVREPGAPLMELQDKSKPIIHDVLVSSAEMLEDARDTIRESAINMLHQGKETAREIPGRVNEISDKTKSAITDIQKKAVETKEEVRQLAHDSTEKVRQSLEPSEDVQFRDAQERGIDSAKQKEHAAVGFVERVKESVAELIDRGKHVMGVGEHEAPSATTKMTSTTSNIDQPSVDEPRISKTTYVEPDKDKNMNVTMEKDKDKYKDKDRNVNVTVEKDKVVEERADLHKARLDAGEFKFD